MTTTFQGLRYKEFIVTCKSTGEQMDLLCQTPADALYTGAELFNVPVEDISVFRPDDW